MWKTIFSIFLKKYFFLLLSFFFSRHQYNSFEPPTVMNHFLIINITSPTEQLLLPGPTQNLSSCPRTHTSLPGEPFHITIIILYVHYFWSSCWNASSGMFYLFFCVCMLKIFDVLWQPRPLMKFDLDKGIFYLNQLNYYFHNWIILLVVYSWAGLLLLITYFFVQMLVGLCLLFGIDRAARARLASQAEGYNVCHFYLFWYRFKMIIGLHYYY